MKITNPYELIAADINKSGNISITDILQLRKLILGVDREFPENKSWRFVEASYKFQDESKLIHFPELKNLNDLDFRGVASVIKSSDYFIGCDSSGQHMAYALDKPGSTWFGGSSSINFGYHNYLKYLKKLKDESICLLEYLSSIIG